MAGTTVSGSLRLPDYSGALKPPTSAFGWFEFIPDRPLDPNTHYNVEIDTSNRAPFLSSFTTGTAADNTPVQLLSSDPAPGQANPHDILISLGYPLDP